MYKQQIDAFFDKNRNKIIDAVAELVEIPSQLADAVGDMPYGVEVDNVLNKAIEMAKEMGFATKNYEGYVITADLSDKETALDILAHLDIVPANPDEWTVTHPFKLKEVDGKIYGRGTSDDKGPAVAALFAMLAIKDLGIPLSKNVRLILGGDEENGSSDIEYYYGKEKPAPATFSPDASFPVINVEKGRLAARIHGDLDSASASPYLVSAKAGSATNVVPDSSTAVVSGLKPNDIEDTVSKWEQDTKQKATITENPDNTITIVVKGIAGHAAYPESANNATTSLLALLASLPLADTESFNKIKGLSRLFPHNDWAGKAVGVAMRDDVSEALTISLNIIQITPTSLDAVFDSRTPITATKENTLDVIVKNCQTIGLKLEDISTTEPHHVAADTPFIKTLLGAYEEFTGNKGYTSITGGGTYVHGLANAVAFGATMPGVNNNVHGADEFTSVDDLLTSGKIFTKVIIDMCS